MPNEATGYDVVCQVGKTYNIFPLASWSFLEGLDAIKRSRPSLNLNLYFLGNRGMINAMGIVWGPQCFSNYVARVARLVFLVLNATVALVHESLISRVAA